MVQKNEEVNFQGRRGRVTEVMGEEPNQAVKVKFDDGSERIIMGSEIENPSGSGESGKSLNEKQIGRGQSGGGNIVPPNTMQRDKEFGKADSRAEGSVEPPLEGGTPEPPLEESGPPEWGMEEKPPQELVGENDKGAGTGDTSEGLKSDGKDVDSPRRRILGLEEIVTYIEPQKRKIVDRNGRRVEVGSTVSLKARVIKFHGADKVEIAYPPYVPVSQIPVWNEEKKQLEMANEEGKPSGAKYEGMQYSYNEGKVVDANGQEVKQEKQPIKQTKMTVESRFVEKF